MRDRETHLKDAPLDPRGTLTREFKHIQIDMKMVCKSKLRVDGGVVRTALASDPALEQRLVVQCLDSPRGGAAAPARPVPLA